MGEIEAFGNEALARALRLMAEHPAIEVVTSAGNPETGTATVEVAVRLGLPNAWMADGVSPGGVRAIEPVTFEFPAAYPLKPPRIRLRVDFDRSLAHVIPGSRDERPVPCIYDGDLAELQQQQGLAGILNQLVAWLENAALGRLIDPKQGWEPVRRDELEDIIIADAERLRSMVSRQEGYAFFRFHYFRDPIIGRQGFSFNGVIEPEIVMLNPKTIVHEFDEAPLHRELDTMIGRSLGVFVWPGKQASGQPFIADQYLPETVTSLANLMDRASGYGCVKPLRTALDWLRRCIASLPTAGPFPIAVVLCARRPFHMINSDSPLELCPYVMEIGIPRLLPEGDQARVRPAGHRHTVSAPLLRSMPGGDSAEEAPPSWIQVGAGSLGSKIALHLGRAGRAPRAVIDRAHLSPHNAARHALVPGVDAIQLSWMGPKAFALARALIGLGQATEAHALDIVAITRKADRAKRLLSKNDWAVVNSTASLTVREALASVSKEIIIPRVIETSLFADGRIGLISIEGQERNPNTGDLITEAYSLMREDVVLRSLVFRGNDALRRQVTGEGCGSATMVMSDAQISMLAAPMAESIATLQRIGLPTSGRILLGVIAEDGMGQSWRTHEVAPWRPVTVDGALSWSIRISDRAHSKILEEVAQWPTAETGGILVGRFSETAQTFYVIDVLPAPDDSSRSAAEFVLGTAGVRAVLKAYAEACNYSLYCLGTWHSHLGVSGPSPRDRATAAAVALARPAPSVLLIHTPAGYRALLAMSPKPKAEANNHG